MDTAVSNKREMLRAKLLDIGEALITEGGIVALRARDLAEPAGCALGSIYNVFDDLGDIAIAVNRRTIDQLVAKMTDAASGLRRESATDRMITLALAYLDYVENEPQRWRTLFSVGIRATDDEPDFEGAIAPVIDLFAEPMDQLGARDPNTAARTLFAALHGVVSLGFERRIGVLPRRSLETRLTRLVEAAAEAKGAL